MMETEIPAADAPVQLHIDLIKLQAQVTAIQLILFSIVGNLLFHSEADVFGYLDMVKAVTQVDGDGGDGTD